MPGMTGQISDTMTDENITEEPTATKPKKQLVTVYVPVEIINEARARGINVSRAATHGLILAIKCDRYKQILEKVDILNSLEKEDNNGIINLDISEDGDYTEE